jgi:hypothetical protein
VNHKEVAARIRATAKRIPLGGTISVRGDNPISAFNFAEACARIVEEAACPHDLYRRLCDQPERDQVGQSPFFNPSR